MNNSVFYSLCANLDFIPKKHECGGGLKREKNEKAIEQESGKKRWKRFMTFQSFHSN